MRSVPWTIVLALVIGAGFRVKAAEHLLASQVTWEHYSGHSTADTNTFFSLLAGGYFRAESTNVQEVVDDWLKAHPKAIVISVSTRPVNVTSPHVVSRFVMTRFSFSRFAY